MEKQKINTNKEVTKFLNDLNHPLRTEIEMLRHLILEANNSLAENIKWNGPNYCIATEDRITMRILPPKQIQLIFHRGVKKQAPPHSKLINDETSLLAWKENDRAVATFRHKTDIENNKANLAKIIKDWIDVTI